MTKKKKAIDKVRASRDGHEYHEAWVARKSLQLLNPTSSLTAIAVEGLSPIDQNSAKSEEVEVADVTLYDGGSNFENSTRVSVLQFKYSIANKNNAFRATDSKDTIKKFAKAYRENIKRFGADAGLKLRFQLVTNRPIFETLTKAIENLANGSKNQGGLLAQEKQFRKAANLTGKQLQQFASLCEFVSYASSLSNSKSDLESALVSLSASADIVVAARLGRLKELVREKAGSAGDSRNVIQRTDVLAALNINDLSDMLPCPAALSSWGKTVERVQLSNTIETISGLDRPLIIHAAGGVGKTVFLSSLADRFSMTDEVVFFDAFGGGAYRSAEDARHLPDRGLIHIANTLSFRGLCDPILPDTPDEQSLIKAFRQRLEQCLEGMSKTRRNRKILLFIDAIDNAEIAANQRRESCFPKILLESLSDNPIKNVRLVASCRSERKPTTYAKYSEIELKPFDKNEATSFLKSRLKNPTSLFIDSAFARSGGNARVLEYFSKDDVANLQDDSKIVLDELLGKRIDVAIEAAKQRGCAENDLTTFLSGLTMLAPPILIEDYALANDVDAKAIESMISDLAPLIEKSKHGVMFKDEPTETLIFKRYGSKTNDLKKIAANLLAAQERSIFAARVLPSFLYKLHDGDRIYNLAYDDRFPNAIESTIGRRKIKYSRLRTAARYAVEQSDFNRLIGFLVELSSIAEVDQRGLSYLLDHPEMVVLSNDSEAIRRIFEARTTWPGTRHARLGLIHTLFGDLEDAHGHLFSLHEWTEHYFRTGRESKFRFDEGPTSLDCAAIPTFFLAKGEHKLAADYFSKWKSWYSFEVGTYFYRYLPLLSERRLISKKVVEKLHHGLSNVGALVASLSFFCHSKRDRLKLVKKLAGKLKNESKIEFTDLLGSRSEVHFQRSLLLVSLNAFNDGSKDSAATVFSSLELDRPRVYAFRDQLYDKFVSLFVLKSIVRAVISAKRISLIDLLPHELHVIGKGIRTTDLNQFTKELQNLVAQYLKSSESEKDRVIRNEDRDSIDRFIKYRLPTIYSLAIATAELLASKNKSKAKFEALVNAWEESSKIQDVYRSNSIDHISVKIGFELIIFALNFMSNAKMTDIEKLISSENLSNLTAASKIKLVQALSTLFPEEDLAGNAAGALASQIEHEDDVTNRANLFARIASSLLPASKDEALAYFKKGLLSVDAIGSGDYRYINELLIFAASARGEELESSEFHPLSNICELNMSNEPHKFYWGAYGNAFSKLAGLRGLAQLSRWDDRGQISLEYTLLPYLIALVRDKKVDPKEAIALNYLACPVEYRESGTPDFAESLFSTKQLSPTETKEMLQQFRSNNTGTVMSSSVSTLARISKEVLGEESSEFSELNNTVPVYKQLIDTTNHHLNLHSSIYDKQFETTQNARKKKGEASASSLVRTTKPENKMSFDRALTRFCKLPHAYEIRTEFFSKLRSKVKYQDRNAYITNLTETSDEFNFYWKIEELKECKTKWSSSSASLDAIFKNVGLRLMHRHADEFIGGDYLHKKYFEEISSFSGITELDLVLELVKFCTQRESVISGSIWLSLASLLSAKANNGVAQAAIKKLLISESAILGTLAADGQWKPELYPTGDKNRILAEFVWKRLGSPDAYDRWRAAHTLRCFARFDRWDIITELARMIDRRDAGSFQASDQKFFDYHARLWFLISLARLVIDYPQKVAPFKTLLDPHTKGHHVLFRHFASQALLGCDKTDSQFLSVQEKEFLRSVNLSSFAPVKSDKRERLDFYRGRPKTAPAPKFKFTLEYDFHKSDVDSLARVFGSDCWELDDLIAESAHDIDPNISSMHDKGGRESHRGYYAIEQIYGAQVAWHALQISAGKLLRKQPELVDHWEKWSEWMSRYSLTREDGYWLSDTLDLIPLDVKKILLESKGRELLLTAEPTVLLGLAGIRESILESIVVGGSWSSVDGVDVEVSSAFVPRELARKSVEALSKEDPWTIWVPTLFGEDESARYSGEHKNHLIPWLVRPETYARLDQFDPYGAIIGCERYRIIRDIVEAYGLKSTDRFSRHWYDEDENLILRSEAWKGPKVDRSDKEYSGRRLTCDTQFLRQLLLDSRLNLILVVNLRRYQNEHRAPGKFSHSIAIIEVDENLEFRYRKGCSISKQDI